MKSFEEYFKLKESLTGVYNYYTKTQQQVEQQAINALQAVLDNLANAKEGRLRYLNNSGYAAELEKMIQLLHQEQGQEQQHEVLGAALGAVAGGAMSGIPGAFWGGVAGHYAQKALGSLGSFSWEMRKHNALENQAIRAMQAVVDRLRASKEEKYYSSFTFQLQHYINWLKKAQEFNNSAQLEPQGTGNYGQPYYGPGGNEYRKTRPKKPWEEKAKRKKKNWWDK